MRKGFDILSEKGLLLLILFVAALLRFWNYPSVAYMHDELSALSRTDYSSVRDVLDYGVAIYDTHPAGVQLFLYFWVKLFGTSEMITKLPFILAGIFSILLAYRIARFWFNGSVGLMVAATMACIQYMVMYGQIIRPYVSGMFFCLWMVWCWSNYFFGKEKKIRWLSGYVVSSALCAYDHHFALLFAVIVAASGLFFLNHSNWKGYLLAGLLIFVLYLPHLNIFLFQFGKGGLGGAEGWLGKPEKGWLLTYLKYVLHFSPAMYVLMAALFVCSLIFYASDISRSNKFRLLAAAWFFSLFLIEFIYSVKVNPVIQYSTVIFGFPFLLIFFFSYFRELGRTGNAIAAGIILLTGTATLVLERKHYELFYKQPYEQIVLNTYRSLDLIKEEKEATIELMIPPYFKELYFKKYNRRFESIYYDPFNYKPDHKAFRLFVGSRKSRYFITGNLPEEYLMIIREQYPYVLRKEEGFTYSTWCFAKERTEGALEEEPFFSKQLLEEKAMVSSAEEYLSPHSFRLNELLNSRHSKLHVSALLYTNDSLSNPIVVADIQENGKSLHWTGAEYRHFESSKVRPNRIHLCFPFTGFDLSKHRNAELKIYVWNKDKKEMQLRELSMEIVAGNKYIYGLFEPLDP